MQRYAVTHTQAHRRAHACIDMHEITLSYTIILFETVEHQFSMNEASVQIGMPGYYISVVGDTKGQYFLKHNLYP
jgi:hypothetical protein